MLGQNKLQPFSPFHPSIKLSSARLLVCRGGFGTHPKMSFEHKSLQQNKCSKKQEIATQSSRQIDQSYKLPSLNAPTLDKTEHEPSTISTLSIFALIITIKLGMQYLVKAFSPHRCASQQLASVKSSSEMATCVANATKNWPIQRQIV